MSKPFHVIATPDENGYTVTIPESPNVSARCADAADIVPTATAAKVQDEQNRHEKTAVCPRCGEMMWGPKARYALSRYAAITVCDRCGREEALEKAGQRELKPLMKWFAIVLPSVGSGAWRR